MTDLKQSKEKKKTDKYLELVNNVEAIGDIVTYHSWKFVTIPKIKEQKVEGVSLWRRIEAVHIT